MVTKKRLVNVIKAKGPYQHFQRSRIKKKFCISAPCEVIRHFSVTSNTPDQEHDALYTDFSEWKDGLICISFLLELSLQEMLLLTRLWIYVSLV